MELSEQDLTKWEQTRERGLLHFVTVRCGVGAGVSAGLFFTFFMQLVDAGNYGLLDLLRNISVFVFIGLGAGCFNWARNEDARAEKLPRPRV